MPDLINLTCPRCGGKLQKTSDIDRIACDYCGNEVIVQKRGEAITIAPVVADLKEVKAGVIRAVSELAINRLESEISALRGKLVTPKRQRKIGRVSTSTFLALVFIASGVMTASESGIGDLSVFLFFGTGILAFLLGLVITEGYKKNAHKINAPIEQMIFEKERELENIRILFGIYNE